MSWTSGNITPVANLLGVICTLLLVYPAEAQSEIARMLPPGFDVPRVARPEPRPGDIEGKSELKFIARGRVSHALDFDRTPLRWSEDALRLTVGHAEHWSPSDYYGMLLDGYELEPGRTIAFIATRKVSFSEPFTPDSGKTLRSLNRPEYTLHQEGSYLVISKSDDRRWYFESIDGGAIWRIAKLERIKQPGLFTRFQYDGRNATALTFHNGGRVEFDYENDLVTGIRTPFGETVAIERGLGGYITRIEIKSDTDNDVTQHGQIHVYERDGEGRIISYRQPNGLLFNIEYSYSEMQEYATEKAVYTSKITRKSDNRFWIRVDEFREDQQWIIQHYNGYASTNDEVSELDSKITMRAHNAGPKGKRWVVTSIDRGGDGSDITYQIDGSGNAKTRVTKDGKVEERRYNDIGRITRRVSDGKVEKTDYNHFGQRTRHIDSRGRESIWIYDNQSRLTKKLSPAGQAVLIDYDDLGHPNRIQNDTISFYLAYDNWGRLIEAKGDHGRSYSWEYDLMGRVITQTSIDANSEPSSRYFEYQSGRLSSIYDDKLRSSRTEAFRYDDKGQLRIWTRDENKKTTYQYDSLNRLIGKFTSEGKVVKYRYHNNGQLAAEARFQHGRVVQTRKYDMDGYEI